MSNIRYEAEASLLSGPKKDFPFDLDFLSTIFQPFDVLKKSIEYLSAT